MLGGSAVAVFFLVVDLVGGQPFLMLRAGDQYCIALPDTWSFNPDPPPPDDTMSTFAGLGEEEYV